VSNRKGVHKVRRSPYLPVELLGDCGEFLKNLLRAIRERHPIIEKKLSLSEM